MKRASLVGALVLFGALLAVDAAAPPLAHATATDAMTPDLRCLVVGLGMAASTDTTRQSAGITFSVYYVGKLDAQGIGAGLEDRVFAEESSMSQADVAAESQRCGLALQARGQALIDMGHNLRAREQARDAAAAMPSKAR